MKVYRLLLPLFLFCCFVVGGYVSAYQPREFEDLSFVSREDRGADHTRLREEHPVYQNILKNIDKKEALMDELKETNFTLWQQKKSEAYKENKKSTIRNEELTKHFSDQYHIDDIVRNFLGKSLRWNFRYHYDKTALIVHHTANPFPEYMTLAQEKDEMQFLYKLHTLKNARGDIGYNFVIGPSGKIYEGKAGGPGVVGAHTKYNNIHTIGVSLMGNFETQQPTQAQLDALQKLVTAIAIEYNIDPMIQTHYHKEVSRSPYIQHIKNYSIVGHKDAGTTACPGKYLYSHLPRIREYVADRIHQAQSKPTRTTSFDSLLDHEFIQTLVAKKKSQYQQQHSTPTASAQQSKLSHAPTLDDVAHLMNQKVSVLLYELSTLYNTFDIVCYDCTVSINGKTPSTFFQNKTIHLTKSKNRLVMSFLGKQIPIETLRIIAGKTPLQIQNYKRSSFAGIPRNTFLGELILTKDYLPTDGKATRQGIAGQHQYVLINKVSVPQYLAGIVETNDQEHFTKNKIMALLAKNYILFYLSEHNRHNSIDPQASYQAIDDPDYFQKYVGAGLLSTLKQWPFALKFTEHQVLTYKGKIAMLPYFTCSAGFTRSAKQKRGREDTPYLRSVLDFGVCEDGKFAGHGVGLGGRGANLLAQRGLSYSKILEYYYPGIEVEEWSK